MSAVEAFMRVVEGAGLHNFSFIRNEAKFDRMATVMEIREKSGKMKRVEMVKEKSGNLRKKEENQGVNISRDRVSSIELDPSTSYTCFTLRKSN